MTTILITGETGTGKSKLVKFLAKGRRLQLVDVLGKASRIQWIPPSQPVDAVVFDHWERFGPEVVIPLKEALAWCHARRTHLVLVAQWKPEVEALDLPLRDALHIELTKLPSVSSITDRSGLAFEMLEVPVTEVDVQWKGERDRLVSGTMSDGVLSAQLADALADCLAPRVA